MGMNNTINDSYMRSMTPPCKILDEETPPQTPMKKNLAKDYSSNINNELTISCKRKLCRDFNNYDQEKRVINKGENNLLSFLIRYFENKHHNIKISYMEESVI